MAGADGGVKSFVPRGNSERALDAPRHRCWRLPPAWGAAQGEGARVPPTPDA